MGYSKCGVSGCKSRPGQGKIFKKFPSDAVLAEKWLSNLPSNFKVMKNTAVCEDHFYTSQFEKVRQDGSRKFKGSAVPSCRLTLPVVVRKPFGDVSNNKNVQASTHKSARLPDHSYSAIQHQCSHISSQDTRYLSATAEDSEAADVLLMLSKHDENKENNMNMSVDSSLDDTNFDPVFNSTFNGDYHVPDVRESSLEVTSSTHDVILDEATGVFTPVLCGSVEPQRDSKEKELEILATYFNDGTVILDEVTGSFIEVSTQSNAESVEIHSATENRESVMDSVMEMVRVQNIEIERLRQENEKKDDTILRLNDTVEFLGSFSAGFTTKYNAMKQSKFKLAQKNRSLEEKLSREFYSPWLSKSQMKRVWRKSNCGLKWEIEDIRDGLILRMQCGSSGYSAFVKRFPFLPSIRCLNQSVQFIRFESGILHEVFDLLKTMVPGMKDTERDCQIVLDEMAIEAGERYCNSLKKWVGKSTLPTHVGRATKGLVFILAGIQRRWKIAVAVYFTNKRNEEAKKRESENLTGKAYAAILDEVVIKAEEIGLLVSGITSDMGADNLAFWKAKGVTGGKMAKLVSSFKNPVRKDCDVFVLPDAVHLLKAVKTMLEVNGTIILPADVVEEEKLPSAIVNYKHVDDLYEFESSCELKVAFRLRPHNIHCNKQFKKMNVGTTKAVLAHRTGVGLKLLAKETGDPSYETTAWFLIFLNTFFSLVLSRNCGLGISKSNQSSFDKAVGVITRMAYIFQNMKVGNGGQWKPAQRDMRVLCCSLLGLVQYFLDKRKYQFLLLGRFTGDCIENLFSCIRLSQPIPHAVAFLQCLKIITLAQFSQAVKGSSYDYDDCSAIAGGDFLEEARRRAKERVMSRFTEGLEELFNHPIRKLDAKDYRMLDQWERSVVYDMAGSIIAAITVANVKVCEHCVNATKWKGPEPHPASVITEMKEFTLLRSDADRREALQISVSEAVFQAILTSEISFRLYREKSMSFEHTDVKQYFVENLMYVWEGSGIPDCHQLGRKILTFFFDARLKEFGKIRREHFKEQENFSTSGHKSSKTVAMHVVADNMTVTGANRP